jgi:single-strand DNA-binding protein
VAATRRERRRNSHQGRPGHRHRPAAATFYDTREGEKRTVIEVDVDDIGPSLRYATARVTRAGKTTTAPATTGGGAQGGDPWTGGGGDDQDTGLPLQRVPGALDGCGTPQPPF